mmetsp:Transcript_42557/g.101434  ORF Transcript_42557/g.101434 Transcript_42557/m.101434 type:complete len:217 (-) Transcript_42557:251-901(-)
MCSSGMSKPSRQDARRSCWVSARADTKECCASKCSRSTPASKSRRNLPAEAGVISARQASRDASTCCKPCGASKGRICSKISLSGSMEVRARPSSSGSRSATNCSAPGSQHTAMLASACGVSTSEILGRAKGSPVSPSSPHAHLSWPRLPLPLPCCLWCSPCRRGCRKGGTNMLQDSAASLSGCGGLSLFSVCAGNNSSRRVNRPARTERSAACFA